MAFVLEAREVSKRYGRVQADSISLQLEEREIRPWSVTTGRESPP
jgi:hypothetical protein